METFTRWISLLGLVMFLFLPTISKGSTCEAPSSPQCFRRNEDESVYTCEWTFNTNESDVTFDLYFKEFTCSKTICGNIKETHHKINEENLIVGYDVNIWVEAHAGNSSCTSPRSSVMLSDTVKYEAPQNESASWSRNDLSLSWPAAEKHPALAEVWFRQDGHPEELWEKRLINSTSEASKYTVIIVNLQEHSAYQVQIRQKSTKAKNPLWSSWSPVTIIPAELKHEPEVTKTIKLLNGTREVKLTWKPVSQAPAVHGVTYTIDDTQSLRCPCKKKEKKDTSYKQTNSYTIYVSYSAVNISVVASNAAGQSPQATVQLPVAPVEDLKICDKTLLDGKLNARTCLEWYELRDADLKPENVMILTSKKQKKKRQQIKQNMRDYIRYLYFEHRCEGGKPRTVKMCFFYKKAGVPNKAPEDITVFDETENSAYLSWKAISYEHHRGLLTHYDLCSVKISSKEEPIECFNISVSATKHLLKNLTPGAKYNISLAGVTQAGKGHLATIIINTLPEKPVNVWWSFGLLFMFFFLSTTCTIVLKRIKNKVFPPVPIPVITDFTCHQTDSEEKWERKEEVHELTLHQLPPGRKSAPETIAIKRDFDGKTESDSEGSSDESVCPDSTEQPLKKAELTDLKQLDTELVKLIYRTGLVFDGRRESS